MKSFNTRLMSLTVNLWAKGSHDVIKLSFMNMNVAVCKKNQEGRETGGDEIKGNCTSLGWQ